MFLVAKIPPALHWSVVIWIRSGVQNKVYFDITAVFLFSWFDFEILLQMNLKKLLNTLLNQNTETNILFYLLIHIYDSK